MQIKKKMSEMKNADVRFISLVHRAANRIPFRVVKSDKEQAMINLSGLGRTVLKGTAAKQEQPEIVGVVVFKQDDEAKMTALKAALQAEGFKVDASVENADNTILFKQGDMPAEEDTTIVRLSENMAVVVKGFSPYSQALTESSDFNEILPAAGFYNGVRTATDALMQTVCNILQKSDSGKNAASAIKDATDKFSTYVGTLTEALPQSAFKADEALNAILAAPASTETGAQTDAQKAEAEKAEKEAAEKAEKEAQDAATAKKAEDDAWLAANPGKTLEDRDAALKAEKQSAAQPDIAALLAQAIGPVMEAVTAIKGSVEKVTEEQKIFKEELEKVARKAEDATQQVSNTVIATVKDDKTQQSNVKKQDDDPRTGLFDTAMFARRR